MTPEYSGVIERINAALSRIEAAAARPAAVTADNPRAANHARLRAAAEKAVAALDSLIESRVK
jgi:hypothetical protein